MKHLLPALLAAMLLGGCAATLERHEPLPGELGSAKVDSARLVEALLEWRGVRVETLDCRWKERRFSVECVLKGEDGRFVGVFSAPMMRLATLTLSKPHAIAFERAASVPETLEPEMLLFDLALANVPPERLHRALGKKFRVRTSPDGKVTVFGPEGRIATLTTLPDGSRQVENLLWDYSYVLKTVDSRP